MSPASGPPVVLIHGMLNSSSHWQGVAGDPRRRLHGDRARPDRPRRLGGAARRLLARRPRREHPRPARRDRHRPRDDRRPLARRRRGDAVLLPVPPARRAARADLQRRPRPRGQPAAAHRRAAGRIGAALAHDPPSRDSAACGTPGYGCASAGPRSGSTCRRSRVRCGRSRTRERASAFLHTLRSVIDVRGQRVSATDRLYLLDAMPTMIVWGERDNTIPIEHGRAAHEAMPSSDFRTIPDVAHFPHLEDPDGLAHMLCDFIERTEPARIEDADWGAVLAHRTPRAPAGGRRRRLSALRRACRTVCRQPGCPRRSCPRRGRIRPLGGDLRRLEALDQRLHAAGVELAARVAARAPRTRPRPTAPRGRAACS